MKAKTVILGIVLILSGIGLFVYYDFYIKPDREARELAVEGRIIYERGDKDSINSAIGIFTKIIAKYPESKYISDAYYHIGRCYENLGLQRLAYLKYAYLLKNNKANLPEELKKETLVRLAHIKVLKSYSEEAINQLYGLLNTNYNNEFRSRIYSELGYTYLKQGEFFRAKRMFDISLSEHGSNEEAILGQARSLKRMNQDKEAYDLYEYFLKYYGAVSQYTGDVKNSYKEQAYNSGLNSFRKGEYNSAISFFNRVLKNFSYDKKVENALYWIGECYYAMQNFTKAIDYFNRTLSNGYYHKDEDARIKKGYAYFNAKKFDLAAREFQIYIHHYPNGKYSSIAKNWKDMSTKELLFRIKTKKLPEVKEIPKEEDEEYLEEPEKKAEEGLEEDIDSELDEEISGNFIRDNMNNKSIKLENVAEL